MNRPAAALLVLVLALAGACTTKAEPGPATPTVLSLDDSVSMMTVGKDYGVVTRVPAELDGRAAALAGWTSDGAEIHTRYAHSPAGDATDDDPYAVVLVARDPRTGDTTVVSDRARRQGPVSGGIPGNALQILSVVVMGDLIAWTEVRGNARSGDLYVRDVSTGTERLLVRATAVGDTVPVMDGEHVYFARETGRMRSSVFRVRTDGSAEPEVVAPGASAVFGDRSPVPSMPDGALTVAFADRVVDWDVERGAEGEIDGTELAADCGASAGEGVRVVCAGSPQELTIDTRDERFVVEGVRGRFAWLQANGRWVMFTVDDNSRQTQYVFDLEREQLLQVPATRNLRGLHTRSLSLAVLGSWEPDASEPVIELRR